MLQGLAPRRSFLCLLSICRQLSFFADDFLAAFGTRLLRAVRFVSPPSGVGGSVSFGQRYIQGRSCNSSFPFVSVSILLFCGDNSLAANAANKRCCRQLPRWRAFRVASTRRLELASRNQHVNCGRQFPCWSFPVWGSGVCRLLPEVVISTEDQDNFVKNLTTIRGEERLALCVKAPAAFLYGPL